MTKYVASTQHRYLCGNYDKITFIVELSFMDVGIDTYDKFQFCQQIFMSNYHEINTENAKMNQMEMFLSWCKLHYRWKEMGKT